jgi:ABC-type multidrug transport system fused ATPase/permease subunit
MPPALWWFWFLTFGLLALVLILCIALGLLGLTLQHQNSLGTSLLFLALAVMLFGPITFLRATWRRRTRVLNSSDVSNEISKAL